MMGRWKVLVDKNLRSLLGNVDVRKLGEFVGMVRGEIILSDMWMGTKMALQFGNRPKSSDNWLRM